MSPVTVEQFVLRVDNLDRHFGANSPKMESLRLKFQTILPELVELEREALLESASDYQLSDEEKKLGMKVFDLYTKYGPDYPRLNGIINVLMVDADHLSDEQIKTGWEFINKFEQEEAEKELERIRNAS